MILQSVKGICRLDLSSLEARQGEESIRNVEEGSNLEATAGLTGWYTSNCLKHPCVILDAWRFRIAWTGWASFPLNAAPRNFKTNP